MHFFSSSHPMNTIAPRPVSMFHALASGATPSIPDAPANGSEVTVQRISPSVERGFGATLGGALRRIDPGKDARKAAEEFVSIAFIEPVLKSLRDSNQAAPPFAPTDAEKSFGPLLDAEIAQRIVAREQYGLVDSVARQLQRFASPASPSRIEIDSHA